MITHAAAGQSLLWTSDLSTQVGVLSSVSPLQKPQLVFLGETDLAVELPLTALPSYSDPAKDSVLLNRPKPAAIPPGPQPPPPVGKHGHPIKHAAHPHHPAKHKHPAPPPKHLAIVSWKPLTLQFIAKHYNAGDGNYADKLQFALDIMSGKIKPEAAPPPKPKAPHKPKHPPMRVPTGRH
jgi:hypothetical protein